MSRRHARRLIVGLSLAGVLTLPFPIARPSAAGSLIAQVGSAKASATVGTTTYTFTSGLCQRSADAFVIMVGDITKGERFELNVPNPVRASDPTATKPTTDGTYTHASVTVIPAGGTSTGTRWHAGGRTAREANISVTLRNGRTAGEFSGRTDGSPRQDIKGSFSC